MTTITEEFETKEFEWRIDNFVLLSETLYCSPRFSFANESWYLGIYPNGDLCNNTIGYLSACLIKDSGESTISVEYSIGLKTADGKKAEERQFTHVFGKNYVCEPTILLKRSELFGKKSVLVPSGVLTLVCSLKYSKSNENAESSKWPPEDSRNSSQNSKEEERERERKRRRKSRWGEDENKKVFIPGLPTVLPNNLNPQQERAYLLQLQIEEISRRLRTGDLGIPPNPEERSPSPEPIYNSEGKRLNTREYRTRKKLEDDRHTLIQEMYSCNPEYKPPPDYKPPFVKVCEKVMIPQEEHPDINFVGLLIGPRGNTLKSIEKETGAKIIIRGKGSEKEGAVGRKDGQPLPGEDEPLHAFVTGYSNESVKKAVNKIREIIREGIEMPEDQNDLRRMQLRQLALLNTWEIAVLNGTVQENDGPRYTNWDATTHKSWQCPDNLNVTNNVICTNCGYAGHIAKDCREQKNGAGGALGAADKAKFDEEYMSLMAELGEGPPPPNKISGIGTTTTSQPTMSALQTPPPSVATSLQATVTTLAVGMLASPPPPPNLPETTQPPQVSLPNSAWTSPPAVNQAAPCPMPPISKKSVLSLFTIADKYDAPDLKVKCIEFMEENLSIDTFCDTITLALKHSENGLLQFATDFFIENAEEIIATVKWQEFVAENPTQSNKLFMKFVSSVKHRS